MYNLGLLNTATRLATLPIEVSGRPNEGPRFLNYLYTTFIAVRYLPTRNSTALFFSLLPKMTVRDAATPLSTAAFVRNEVPQTIFRAQIHKNEQGVTAEVNDYFLKHWPFENERARMKFIAVGFSRVTCYYFPLALDDRIALACRLITLLFLIDGM